LIEEIAFIFLGMAIGTITGLVPGIHANTIAFIALILPIEKTLALALLIISMSITHSFVDAIPNILFGAASEENFLTIMPGQQMLLEGKGIEAIQLTIFGGITTTLFAIILAPFFYSFAINYGEQLPIFIPALLVLVLAIMVFSEGKKIEAIIVIFLSGALGIIALDSGIKNSIIALVIGFFAIPSIIQSIFSKIKIPEQKKTNPKHKISKGAITGIASGLTAVFPGIGPGQAAFMIKKIFPKMKREDYLIITGGMNTGNLIFSILMLFALEKTRTGMAVALNGMFELNFGIFLLFGITAITSAGFSTIITEKTAFWAIKLFKIINYQKLSMVIFAIVVAVVFFSSGVLGLLVCACAAGISFFGIGAGTKRSNAMAFLIIPTLLFYLGMRI